MKKLWIITIAFLVALYGFSACSHTDDYGTQSNVSNTAQASQEDGGDIPLSDTQSGSLDGSDTGENSLDGEGESSDTSSDGDSTATGTDEEGDVVPPITNGGNFDGTV